MACSNILDFFLNYINHLLNRNFFLHKGVLITQLFELETHIAMFTYCVVSKIWHMFTSNKTLVYAYQNSRIGNFKVGNCFQMFL